MKKFCTLILISLFIMSSCNKENDDAPIDNGNQTSPPKLTSSMFIDKGILPKETGRYNGNVSPDLKIENVPTGTVEMVLAMRDIDAANSWHWAIWDIPPTKTTIAKGEPWTLSGVTIGKNDFNVGYTGPFPPSEHKYVFTVYFLKSGITLVPAEYKSLETAMQGKLISQVSISGNYKP